MRAICSTLRYCAGRSLSGPLSSPRKTLPRQIGRRRNQCRRCVVDADRTADCSPSVVAPEGDYGEVHMMRRLAGNR